MLRKKATFSQEELAERAGVGRATISRLERGGNASYETIKRLAEALGTERTRLTQKPRPSQKRKCRRGVSKG
jgi:transcriptional regulator with XRE-family HTH domain